MWCEGETSSISTSVFIYGIRLGTCLQNWANFPKFPALPSDQNTFVDDSCMKIILRILGASPPPSGKKSTTCYLKGYRSNLGILFLKMSKYQFVTIGIFCVSYFLVPTLRGCKARRQCFDPEKVKWLHLWICSYPSGSCIYVANCGRLDLALCILRIAYGT